jgi:hypothetical protein
MELNRFKQLLESTIGDVKPLITETDKKKIIQSILNGPPARPQYSDFSSDPEYDDSNEDISYDIKSVECDGNEMGGNVYIDEDDTIVIRYCKGDSKKLDYLKRKGKMELYSKHGL